MDAAALSVFIRNFREAAPYIDYLRGKTLVVGIASGLLQPERFRSVAADLALVAGLGVRLVLVYGSRSQINELSSAAGISPQYHQGRRITDETVLDFAKQACGKLRFDIEAALSLGPVHSPRRGGRLKIAAGNFLSARPIGIIDGIDMGYTGRVRKIDAASVSRSLDEGAVVLLNPLAASASGKLFNLSMAEIAETAAVALKADKLLFLIGQDGILDENGRLLPNLSAEEAEGRLKSGRICHRQHDLLDAALNAVGKGVGRCQILSGLNDGALIGELFTRNGTGTSIAQNPFMCIRPAEGGDIADIVTMIRPLEEAGILLRRSLRYLETHIGDFSVLEHDRRIYGCVAVKTFADAPDCSELACLAVSSEAQDGGYGELLLEHSLDKARRLGCKRLFALSTQTGDWFAERGFQTASPEDLPLERQREYWNSKRGSAVFVYEL